MVSTVSRGKNCLRHVTLVDTKVIIFFHKFESKTISVKRRKTINKLLSTTLDLFRVCLFTIQNPCKKTFNVSVAARFPKNHFNDCEMHISLAIHSRSELLVDS
jgi:hypothetical protein